MRIIVGYLLGLLGKSKKRKSDAILIADAKIEETRTKAIKAKEIGFEDSTVVQSEDSAVIEIKVSDIDPVGRHPEDILSNMCKNTFCIDGVYCQCMEQFLQSLKYQDENIQIEICSSTFYDIEVDDTSDWQKDQILWWKGHPINRHSPEYHDFIYNAYMEMYLWSARFRNVLMSTEGKTLLFNSGNTNPYKTILTEKLFKLILRC